MVTGAFSYTGRYVTRLLLNRGWQVRTLTNHPGRRDSFGGAVDVFRYDFEHPEAMRAAFDGATTLINTYWIRFPRGQATFERAVGNSRALIGVARDAGVRRVVHVSIANASRESPLAYYSGKAQVEDIVAASGLAHTILRPTVIFGAEDILINNIAWFVRHFPVFAVPGDGRYGLRPIYVEDMARLIADAADDGGAGGQIVNAVGPETFAFRELVGRIASLIGVRARIAHVPPRVAYAGTRMTGWFVRDVVLTWEEYLGLMANLLVVDGPATGPTRLTQWLGDYRKQVGRYYASELERHYR
ncbi:MAG TPA: NAD(P)H-binding protein [Vicinamibacterales bacterium]|nr:NAD(P)H-binding protein [Vicinamibacterales bacterium]